MSYMRLCFGVVVKKSELPYAEILPNVHGWWHFMCGCGKDFATPGKLMKCMSDKDMDQPVYLWEISGEKDLWIVSPTGGSVRTAGNYQGVNLTRMIRTQERARMTPYYEFLESIEYDFLEVLPSWFLARTEN